MLDDNYEFLNRRRIRGTLTTDSPLRIGDGEVTHHPRITNANNEPVDISSVCTDHNEQAYIPGSSLKGVLRAWITKRRPGEALIREVFGGPDANGEDLGGKAVFRNTFLSQKPEGADTNDHRWWRRARGTCIAPGVAIDPVTRTADNQKLFYREFVPEDTVFDVEILAQNLKQDELELLLEALEGFNHPNDRIRIGAETANQWGGVHWEPTCCGVLEASDVATWIKACRSTVQFSQPAFRQETEDQNWFEEARRNAIAATTSAARLDINLHLDFQGAFLVDDPSQHHEDRVNPENSVSHATVMKRNGKYFLPGSSLRGALRAQAARIWRTLHHPGGPAAATDLLDEAKRGNDEKTLRPFLKLFGAPGWKSPLDVPDFLALGDPLKLTQEFLAIDRFTGGGADGRKFNAHALYQPEFEGIISLDLARVAQCQAGPWSVLLLLLALRDLMEEDIPLGFGASKGYGACRALVTASYSTLPSAWRDSGIADLVAAFPFSPDAPPEEKQRLLNLIRPLFDSLKSQVQADPEPLPTATRSTDSEAPNAG